MHRSQLIPTLLRRTVSSLKGSFANYWPADVGGNNDPCEQNVALHLAHHLPTKRFSVFAEVIHPDGGRIDLLGVAPAADWFLALEAKRFLCNKPRECANLVLEDVKRLRRFRLQDATASGWLGLTRESVCHRCKTGVGVVGGLLWVPGGSNSPLLRFWKSKQPPLGAPVYKEISDQFANLNAVWPDPMLAWTHEGFGAYYLLSAYFQIPRLERSGPGSNQ